MKKTVLEEITLLLLFLFLLIAALILARQFLIPICFSALLAMLMLPMSNKLEKWGLSRGIATAICIFTIILTFSGIITLLSSQVIKLGQDLPTLKEQLNCKLEIIQKFVERKTNVAPEKQMIFARARINSMLESADVFIKKLLMATTGTLATLGLMLIHIFFFMYYRDKFRTFLRKVTQLKNEEVTNEVTNQIGLVTQRYLSGVIIVVGLLSILNTTALLIIGIPNALFFGCLAAILNVVPYIGVLVGSLFPIIMALLTKESIWYAVAVAGAFAFNQFLENNFLTPNIVGSHVKINPLAAIMAIFAGSLIWGLAGMVLFIPLLAITKIIFDHIDSLRPYGYLIGGEDDDEDGVFKRIKCWFKLKVLKRKTA